MKKKYIELKKLYSELKELKVPKFPKNEELGNWIEDLFEVDSYYAGLALSASEGEKISKKDLISIENLRQSLNSITVQNENDKKILKDCQIYFKKIEQLYQLLSNCINGN